MFARFIQIMDQDNSICPLKQPVNPPVKLWTILAMCVAGIQTFDGINLKLFMVLANGFAIPFLLPVV